jgi:hypothetical protein
MDFKTYQKSIDQVNLWRSFGNDWPDSRDPAFSTQLIDTGITPQDIEKSLVALISWRLMRDARYQGISAMVHLIRNRQVKGMVRSHLIDLEFQTDESYPDEQDYDFLQLLERLDDILAGKTVDITDGAINFSKGTPKSEGIITKIGEYSFYR